jgi:hypothetical protein
MEIGVVSIADGDKYQKTVKPAMDTLNRYCFRHKYPLFNEVPEFVKTPRGVTWWRIPLIQYVMRQHPELDLIAWFDADVILTNQPVSIKDKIQHYSDEKHVILSSDIVPRKVNPGVMFLRNTPWTRLFLGLWDSQSDLVAAGMPLIAVLNFLLKGDIGNCLARVEIEPSTQAFNQMHSWKPEYFANHVAGFHSGGKLSRLTALSRNVIQ